MIKNLDEILNAYCCRIGVQIVINLENTTYETNEINLSNN